MYLQIYLCLWYNAYIIYKHELTCYILLNNVKKKIEKYFRLILICNK